MELRRRVGEFDGDEGSELLVAALAGWVREVEMEGDDCGCGCRGGLPGLSGEAAVGSGVVDELFAFRRILV